MEFNNINEIWKPIIGYENYYEISNLGRVKSLNYNRTGKQKILKLQSKNGYLQVHISKNGIHKWYLVHRLVAQAFIPNTNNLPQVNHINEDKTDNKACNLEWCSNSYNVNYGTRNEKVSKALKISKASKPIIQYTLNGEYVKTWNSKYDVYRTLGYLPANICACCKGKYKTAYGFKWEYN